MMIGRPARDRPASPIGSLANASTVASLAALGVFVLVVLALLVADIVYLVDRGVSARRFGEILFSDEVLSGILLSLITSTITLVLVLLTAVPTGFALSRLGRTRRGGRVLYSLLNAMVDVPIVLPPVVIGLSLLALFGSKYGQHIRAGLATLNLSLISWLGIVLCQFLVAAPYCVRAVKASFDSVDHRLEAVALSLGLRPLRAFWHVTLPLSFNGLLAGGITAWARAIGVFGPLMVFVGTSPRVQVMPTAMWLELSIGNIEVSLVIALVAVALSGLALAAVHLLVPGKQWS